MTRPVLVPADSLAIVRSALEAGLPAERVVLTSPRDTTTPWLRLTRIGGGEAPVPVLGLEVAQFDLAAFAPPSTPDASRVAHDLCRRALGVLRAALGHEAEGGCITRVELTTAPAWEPDETRSPPTARFVATVSVYVRTWSEEELHGS